MTTDQEHDEAAQHRADASEAAPICHYHRGVKALEQAIEHSPDDPAPYLVLADQLQSKGDPRGELIALQHAGAGKSAAGAKARAAANKLLAKHADVFLGPLAAYPEGKWMMGFGVSWRFGFIEKAEIDYRTADGKTTYDAVTAIGELLAHPSARFLRELVVHAVSEDNDYRPVVELITAAKRPTLDRLAIESENSSTIGDVSALWTSCPNLGELRLVGNEIVLGRIKAPKLRVFSIDDRLLSKAAVASIGAAKWPLLESLTLRADSENPRFTAAELLPILTGRGLANLKELGIVELRDADAMCEALAASKLGAQIEHLNLAVNGWMTDKGALALAARKGGWPKLGVIDLIESSLEKPGRDALKKICKKVRFKW